MTNFERVGVNLQLDSHNVEEAKEKFAHSCECCCSTGRYSDCNRCSISYTHTLIMAYFNDKNKK